MIRYALSFLLAGCHPAPAELSLTDLNGQERMVPSSCLTHVQDRHGNWVPFLNGFDIRVRPDSPEGRTHALYVRDVLWFDFEVFREDCPRVDFQSFALRLWVTDKLETGWLKNVEDQPDEIEIFNMMELQPSTHYPDAIRTYAPGQVPVGLEAKMVGGSEVPVDPDWQMTDWFNVLIDPEGAAYEGPHDCLTASVVRDSITVSDGFHVVRLKHDKLQGYGPYNGTLCFYPLDEL